MGIFFSKKKEKKIISTKETVLSKPNPNENYPLKENPIRLSQSYSNQESRKSSISSTELKISHLPDECKIENISTTSPIVINNIIDIFEPVLKLPPTDSFKNLEPRPILPKSNSLIEINNKIDEVKVETKEEIIIEQPIEVESKEEVIIDKPIEVETKEDDNSEDDSSSEDENGVVKKQHNKKKDKKKKKHKKKKSKKYR